ncbi:MAG: DinB family protein [Isosphaeraceae bacterium]
MANDLIDHYAMGAEVLNYAAQGLSLEQERSRPGPGTWSLAELVAHVLDADLVISDRIKRVIAEDRPTLLAFDENAWIERLDSNAMPMVETAALFAANRRWMVRLLRNRPEPDFGRIGVHSSAGPLTLAELVAKATGHLDHHLRFLYAKRASLGVSLYPRYASNDAAKD